MMQGLRRANVDERGVSADDGRTEWWQRPRPVLGVVLLAVGIAVNSSGQGFHDSNPWVAWPLYFIGGAIVMNGLFHAVGVGSPLGNAFWRSFWPIWFTVTAAMFLVGWGVNVSGGRTAMVYGYTAVVVVVAGLAWVLTELRTAEERLAEAEAARQRQWIAADVHDIVGHTLAATMLHVNAARMSLPGDTDVAVQSLEEAERAGRAGMEEIRSVVRLLRSGGESSSHSSPDLDDLSALVESLEAAGATIHTAGSLPTEDVTRLQSITMYRLAQEGLTNAVKHGTGPVDLQFSCDDGMLAVEITNPIDRNAGRKGSGVGLAGAGDRVTAMGGTVEAGPNEAGDRWRFVARLPT